jgi:hypothetical protein
MKTNSFETKVKSLLARHGYSVAQVGGKYRLIEKAIPGFTIEKIHPETFNTLQGCVDKLCWLSGAEFSADYHANFPNV